MYNIPSAVNLTAIIFVSLTLGSKIHVLRSDYIWEWCSRYINFYNLPLQRVAGEFIDNHQIWSVQEYNWASSFVSILSQVVLHVGILYSVLFGNVLLYVQINAVFKNVSPRQQPLSLWWEETRQSLGEFPKFTIQMLLEERTAASAGGTTLVLGSCNDTPFNWAKGAPTLHFTLVWIIQVTKKVAVNGCGFP